MSKQKKLIVHSSGNKFPALVFIHEIDAAIITQITGTATVEIGSDLASQAANVWFNGSITQPMIFSRALSAGEVKLLYDLTSKKYIYPYPKQITE